MRPNIDPDTGTAYGYISANALDPDIVNELQMNGDDVYYEEALKEFLQHERDKWAEEREGDDEPIEDEEFDEDAATQRFADGYYCDEPVHEGTKDGVKYRTSWLGGALNVWIFESPYITETAVACSPCVPGAGNLDQVGEGSYRCYDVPPEWRVKQDDGSGSITTHENSTD
jgi:hypothetical protein